MSTPPKSPAGGPAWRRHVAMGETADAILVTTTQLSCCGIVDGINGTRGLRVVQSVPPGPVTEKRVRHSKLPVRVVP